MATLTIRDLDDAVKTRLRVRAARNGRSMEAEARVILRAVLDEPAAPRGLGSRIQQRFADLEDSAGLDGGDLSLPPRTEPPRAADLTE